MYRFTYCVTLVTLHLYINVTWLYSNSWWRPQTKILATPLIFRNQNDESCYEPSRLRDAEGLIFYRCGIFFPSFLTPYIGDHWTDLNQTSTQFLCYLKKLVRTYLPPTGWRQKPLTKTDFELWPNIPCNGIWYQQSARNLSIHRDSLTCLQTWWTLAQKRLRTVGKFLSTPPQIFALGDTASLTTHVI